MRILREIGILILGAFVISVVYRKEEISLEKVRKLIETHPLSLEFYLNGRHHLGNKKVKLTRLRSFKNDGSTVEVLDTHTTDTNGYLTIVFVNKRLVGLEHNGVTLPPNDPKTTDSAKEIAKSVRRALRQASTPL